MDKTVRVMIINYGDSPATCNVTFEPGTKIKFYSCLPPPTSLGGSEHLETLSESPFQLDVPVGGIRGFKIAGPVTLEKPASGLVQVITAAGKDPWPPPPLAPSTFQPPYDFSARYYNFLSGGGTPGTEPTVKIQLEVIDPAGPNPAQRAHPDKHAKART